MHAAKARNNSLSISSLHILTPPSFLVFCPFYDSYKGKNAEKQRKAFLIKRDYTKVISAILHAPHHAAVPADVMRATDRLVGQHRRDRDFDKADSIREAPPAVLDSPCIHDSS